MRKELLVFALLALLIAGCLATSTDEQPVSQPIYNSSEHKYTAENVEKIMLAAPKLSVNYQALADEINTRRKVEIAVATKDGIIANPRLNPKSRATAQKVIDEYVGNVEDRAVQTGKKK